MAVIKWAWFLNAIKSPPRWETARQQHGNTALFCSEGALSQLVYLRGFMLVAGSVRCQPRRESDQKLLKAPISPSQMCQAPCQHSQIQMPPLKTPKSYHFDKVLFTAIDEFFRVFNSPFVLSCYRFCTLLLHVFSVLFLFVCFAGFCWYLVIDIWWVDYGGHEVQNTATSEKKTTEKQIKSQLQKTPE